jgi:hypothetical protein
MPFDAEGRPPSPPPHANRDIPSFVSPEVDERAPFGGSHADKVRVKATQEQGEEPLPRRVGERPSRHLGCAADSG